MKPSSTSGEMLVGRPRAGHRRSVLRNAIRPRVHSAAERSSIRGDAGPADQPRERLLARSGRLRPLLHGALRSRAHPVAELRLPRRLVSASATRSCTSSRRGRQGAASATTSASRSTTSSRSTARARELGVIDPVVHRLGARARATATCSSTCATRAATSSRSTGPWATYTTDDIPELKPLDGALAPGPRERRRPALPVNSLLEAR